MFVNDPNFKLVQFIMFVWYGFLYLALILFRAQFYFKRINELKYENYIRGALAWHIMIALLIFIMSIHLLLPEYAYAFGLLYLPLNIIPLIFYRQLTKKDTPFKRYELEREKLQNQHDEIMRRHVLLNEINLKQQNLEKSLV